MLKERLNQLFKMYNPAIRSLISQVLTLEQENISLERRHRKVEIDQIVSQLASKEIENISKEDNPSRSLFE